MASRKEIDAYYQEKYGKNFPSATLTKWIHSGKVRYEVLSGNKYDYNLEDFANAVNDPKYITKMRARKENPQDYIGKTKGYLYIKGVVPKDKKESGYNGTLMYCDCLLCGNKDVQVRFTYLSDNGNYDQLTCGCGRKIRAFMASAKREISENFLTSFADFDKFLFVHKMLTHVTDGYYNANCNKEEYENAIKTLYDNPQFNAVYNFWKANENKTKTFYDLSKPSLDHIIPLSRGGTSKIDNLQVLTVFENLAKRDMTAEEWKEFKQKTNTHSAYFIEEVMSNEK